MEARAFAATCSAFDGYVSSTDFRSLAHVWGSNGPNCMKLNPDIVLLVVDGKQALSYTTSTGLPYWMIEVNETSSWHYHKAKP